MQSQAFLNLFEPHTTFLDGLGITRNQQEQLAMYLERLWTANQTLNLFSRKLSPSDLVLDHLFDCLTALPYFPTEGTIADLGSGGGLPGIALALCRPHTQFLLFEKSPKKQRFLTSLQDLCGNTSVQGLLEPGSLPRDVAMVTARAFKPIAVILEMTRNYAQSGGRYLLYKGRLGRIQEELDQAVLGQLKSQIHALPILGQADERHLVALER